MASDNILKNGKMNKTKIIPIKKDSWNLSPRVFYNILFKKFI